MAGSPGQMPTPSSPRLNSLLFDERDGLVCKRQTRECLPVIPVLSSLQGSDRRQYVTHCQVRRSPLSSGADGPPRIPDVIDLRQIMIFRSPSRDDSANASGG